MQSTGPNGRRIALFVAPAAIALAVVVVAPVILAKADARRERIERARAERLERVKMGLEPCGLSPGESMDDRLAPAPGEFAIDVLPAFSSVYGLRISARSLQSYRGDQALLFPPPPPDPALDEPPAAPPQPRLEMSRPVDLSPQFGRQLSGLLRAEIEHAAPSDHMGLDGVTFFFRDGDRCAMTWSPPEGTRAHQLTRLVDDLVRLAEANGGEHAQARDRIRHLLVQLETHRQLAERQQ